ncbi:MAG: signal peptidase I [Bacilli bacterium]|nr:signal peptidase I [Bacilli bacterium]
MQRIKELIPYVIIIIVVILIRTFIVTPVRVDGSSMDKFLQDGNILLLYRLGKIHRYDIVVLDEKADDEIIIKRVIGMPGETIEIKNNKIFINEEEIDDDYAFGETSNYEKITLKDDEYFLLGDNRLISKDSRSFGPINKSDIKGVTTIRLYPFNKIGFI